MTSQRFYLFIDIGGLIRVSNAKKSKLLIKALFLEKQNLKRYSMYTGHRLDFKKKEIISLSHDASQIL